MQIQQLSQDSYPYYKLKERVDYVLSVICKKLKIKPSKLAIGIQYYVLNYFTVDSASYSELKEYHLSLEQIRLNIHGDIHRFMEYPQSRSPSIEILPNININDSEINADHTEINVDDTEINVDDTEINADDTDYTNHSKEEMDKSQISTQETCKSPSFKPNPPASSDTKPNEQEQNNPIWEWNVPNPRHPPRDYKPQPGTEERKVWRTMMPKECWDACDWLIDDDCLIE